jgi:serine/threonine-protein kinase RsbW
MPAVRRSRVGVDRPAYGNQNYVEIHLTLCLPRDELSIPIVRHICRSSMAEVGVTRECAGDIEVALAEACTNVLVHSGPSDVYEVALSLDGEVCTIRVVDAGRGFDAAGVDRLPEASSESGRGVALMRGLVDRVLFTARPERGTIVHLEKALDFVPGAPAIRLGEVR